MRLTDKIDLINALKDTLSCSLASREVVKQANEKLEFLIKSVGYLKQHLRTPTNMDELTVEEKVDYLKKLGFEFNSVNFKENDRSIFVYDSKYKDSKRHDNDTDDEDSTIYTG